MEIWGKAVELGVRRLRRDLLCALFGPLLYGEELDETVQRPISCSEALGS